MKTRKSILALLILLIVTGCSKEILEVVPQAESSEEKSYCVQDVNSAVVNPHATTYYELIKTAILATNSNLPQTRGGSTDSISDNPFVEKLENLDILDENGDSISFFSMNEEEQAAFLDDWATLEANDMSEKLSIEPELETYIQEQNEIVEQTIQEEAIRTRSGGMKIVDKERFFKKIEERMRKMYLETEEQQANLPSTRITVSTEDRISTDILKSSLQHYARRGDFIVALPKHNTPWIFLNIGDTQFKVGHAAIINKNVTTSWANNATFTWGTQLHGGVKNETLDYWSVRSYIMGIQKVTWKWKWRGFKSRLYKTVTPVSNPAALAEKAGQYAGREYVKWYEFPTAKWAAPSRFTCTTLVWYCAKKVYGVNVSSWWASMVSPSGLYLDSGTYVRKEVK